MFKLLFVFLVLAIGNWKVLGLKDESTEYNSSSDIKICNSIKLKAESEELETVKVALKRVVAKFLRGFGPVVLEYSKLNGNQVWSKGVCYHKASSRACIECLEKLIDQVLVGCDNAKGAEYMARDCFIRYEFYSFV